MQSAGYHDIDVPAAVRAHAAGAPGGRGWLAGLPSLLTALEQAWDLRLTEWLPGGTTSLVARATTGDGRAVVVKVAVPGPWFEQQVRTLAAADGNGYVRLLDYDEERHAALLEALGPALPDSGLPVPAQLSILGRLVRRGWRLPADAAQARDKAAELSRLVLQLWEQLGQPCSEQVLEQALRCAGRLSAAFDPLDAVLVHGDAAAANAARVLVPRAGTADGFVLLDPDEFVGDRAYDLGVAVRDWSTELLEAADPGGLYDGWCRLLAEQTGVDSAAISDWGYLERVSTGLYALSLTAEAEGFGHLRSAQALVDAWAAAAP